MFFISYQRDSISIPIVNIIKRDIESYYGDNKVFLDHKSIKTTISWEKEIKKELSRSFVVIAFFHKQFDLYKFRDSNNWMRKEILHAINRGILVVPVFYEVSNQNALTKGDSLINRLLKIQAINIPDFNYLHPFFIDTLTKDCKAVVDLGKSFSDYKDGYELYKIEVYLNEERVFSREYTRKERIQNEIHIEIPIGQSLIKVIADRAYTTRTRGITEVHWYRFEGSTLYGFKPQRYILNIKENQDNNLITGIMVALFGGFKRSLEILLSSK